MTTSYIGAIEAGGTKCICALVDSSRHIVREAKVPTTTPEETLGQIAEFFKSVQQPLTAIGVSCFGPIELDSSSSHYGFITSTPKLAWRNTDFLAPLREFKVPIAFDTDVNGAAYAEYIWGAGQNLSSLVYYTIGTGIGGGAIINGAPLHGLSHPEMGHMQLPHDLTKDPFVGSCPSHRNCFEGLASGPAMEARWGQLPATLEKNHPAWELESHYVALALVNTICVLSPQRIILGGGVMQNEFLFPLIRANVQQLLNQYVQFLAILIALSFPLPLASVQVSLELQRWP